MGLTLDPAQAASSALPPALLAAAQRLTPERIATLGSTLVVAPHPDDETLGCGGLIALVSDAGLPVWALLVTDGSASHPGSRRFSATARAALRNAEWQAALTCLGVPAARRLHLGLIDGAMPEPATPAFDDAAATLSMLLARVEPRTLVLPWQRDPHPDHVITHALLQAALQRSGIEAPRQLQYTVWLHERALPADLPQPGEVRLWQLDIAAALERKRRAIDCHRSQLGLVIDDDAGGFTLAPAMRERAASATEHYLETVLIPT